MIYSLKTDQKGFTLTELLIATTVFSTILLVAVFALLQMGRTYYKGAAIARTQNVTRSVMDSVVQDIQYSSTAPRFSAPTPGATDPRAVCMGSSRYTFRKGVQVGGAGGGALLYDTNADASCSPSASSDAKELLGEGMRLARFEVAQVGSTGGYGVGVKIIFGDEDYIEIDGGGNYVRCKTFSGSTNQFCAHAELNSTVQRRVSGS